MDCVYVPFRGCAFEQDMVVAGDSRTGLSVSRTAMLLGFSRSTVSCVYQEWSTTQRTSNQLDTTGEALESIRASIPLNFSNTLCFTTPPCPDELRLF